MKEFNYFNDNAIIKTQLTNIITTRLTYEIISSEKINDLVYTTNVFENCAFLNSLEKEINLSKNNILTGINKHLIYLEEFDLCYLTSSQPKSKFETFEKIYKSLHKLVTFIYNKAKKQFIKISRVLEFERAITFRV